MPKPLTFEQFTARDPTPKWDGFHLYFVPESYMSHVRQTPQFLDLQAKEPDLEGRLTSAISSGDRSADSRKFFKPLEQNMHKAYLVMFDYLVEHDSLNPHVELMINPN